jgi:hypothetical protein
VLDTNVMGIIHGMQAFVPEMEAEVHPNPGTCLIPMKTEEQARFGPCLDLVRALIKRCLIRALT